VENAANTGVVTTESESVEVDEWLIGRGSIELNPNTPRSSPDSCTLVADGNNKEDGICECDRREVKRYRSCGGGIRWMGSGRRSLERARRG
jgi:hypothetical protein